MISDNELREAARQYEKALLAALPEPEDCTAVFSPGFERKMKKLIFRTDHPVRFWLFRLIWPLLALLAAGLAVTAMLPAKQAGLPPAHPETEAPTASAELLSPSAEPAAQTAEPEPEATTEPEPAAVQAIVYRPTWLPEGCGWNREALYDNEGMIVYRTTDGTEAVFHYDLTGAEMEAEGKEVPVRDGTGTLLLDRNKKELNELFWSDETTGVSFWLSAPFAEEDMIRVAESVEAAE